MKARSFLLAAALVPLSLGSAHAATISNGGLLVPTTNILTGDSTTTDDMGTRPITWNATQSPARGQSFTVPGSGDFTVQAIWVRLASKEIFSNWTSNSLTLKLLGDPVTRSATSLGDFDYDATGLGTVQALEWLRLGLGSGVTLTAGTEYSFLLSPNEQNSNHSVSITRQKTNGVYSGGKELEGRNQYDRVNWDTDPWNDVGTGDTITTLNSNIFFYVEGVAVPEPSGASLLLLSGLGLLRRRRA